MLKKSSAQCVPGMYICFGFFYLIIFNSLSFFILSLGFPTQLNPQALMYDPLYEPISGQSSISQYKPNFGLGGPSSHYDDNFGPCSKCLEMIIGEGTGCMARGQLFHIKCFTCHKCGCQLQGQPFYPIDGKVFFLNYHYVNSM